VPDLAERQEENIVSLLALLRVKDGNWHVLAREAQRPGGLEALLAGRTLEVSNEAKATLAALRPELPALDRYREEVVSVLELARKDDIRLTTPLDEDYPVNLRTIFNLPPFLFYRGTLMESDARAVAVVGTREASDQGLQRARQMAQLLTKENVTVLSGLARGIDSAAHQACLEVGGRTIAVVGSGIRHVYPPENEQLMEEIVEHGAVVSQFWPDARPTKYSFPLRNVVMSGMGQGTVVIEASATSGAKMQARLALQHGKKVWLLQSLVDSYPWAQKYLARGARKVDGIDAIVRDLSSPDAIRERTAMRLQLTLAL
jgi:DNA processing protein